MSGLSQSGVSSSTASNPVSSKVASASQTQLGATALAWGYNLCTGNIADTLRLPAATGSGRSVQVFSSTPYFITVYPASGEQISTFGANAAYAVIANQLVEFIDQGAAQWQILSNLPIMYPIYFLTAFAGGGQASATQAGYATNVVTVCATNNDSIKLPVAIGGLQQLFVSNYGAASLRIYPTTGTYLNNVLNGTYDLAANKTAMFLDTGPNPHNQWSGGALA